MQQKIFTIRDSKGEFYSPPFYKNTHGEAERDFHTASKDPNTNISKYPEDFDLYCVGEFDNLTGKIKPLDTPQHIVKATAFSNQKLN